MRDFGFVGVVPKRVTWNVKHNCYWGRDHYCVMHKKYGEDCECYEDLYLRKDRRDVVRLDEDIIARMKDNQRLYKGKYEIPTLLQNASEEELEKYFGE